MQAGLGMSKKSNPSPVITLAKKRKAQVVAKGEKVYLESVLGLTCVNPNLLSVCGTTGCTAYPAGCVAVLYYSKKNRYSYVFNTSRKHIASLCLSDDGKYLAIGECGHQPCVRVWDISSVTLSQVAELKGHNYGISSLVFSPNSKYLVSVGYQHDMAVNVWNWKAEKSVASNKMNAVAFGAAFSEDGSYFVVVGNRRVRYWYFDTVKDGKSGSSEPLKGRSAVLGDLQDNCFVAVACGRGLLSNSTYTLTSTGLLCLFNEQRVLDKYTDLKAAPAFCLSLTEQCLLCGCAGGVVRVFDPFTLDYITTLPKPHNLGINVATADPGQLRAQSGDAVKYPDTIAIAMDTVNLRLTVIYNDHSLYIWDLRNVAQVGKCHSFLYHSSCVWDICAYPHMKANNGPEFLPHSSFVTCSSDNTIRFWCLDPSQEGIRNIYSKELVSVIYTAADLNCLKDGSKMPGDASAVADSTRGVRCVQFHPSGHQLATGDRSGNLRVYSLEFMDEVVRVEAHDSDVLSIEYSPLFEDQQYLATSSRDRLIHVFRCGSTHQHMQTLDEHSASITSIKFTGLMVMPVICPDAHENGKLQLLSCGADKSIIFRTLEKSTFTLANHVASKGAIYDMDIDPTGKHMVTTGQDKFMRIYQVSTGKQKSVLKASPSEEGSLLKISLDPSGLYAAAVSSDKSISVFDFYSGECQAKLTGHSEIVTQVCFSVDCKYLYSVSADSCIFVWRLSDEMTKCMHDRLAELGRPVSPSLALSPPLPSPRSLVKKKSVSSENLDTTGSEEATDGPGGFQLSVSQLPSWARKKVIERPSIVKSISTGSLVERGAATDGGARNPLPEGRWAQRVNDGMTFAKAERSDSDIETDDLTTEFMKVIDAEDDEGDESEEVVYLQKSTQLEVDASSFHVTTPEKPQCKVWEEEGKEERDSDTEEPQERGKPPGGDEPFEDFFLGKKFGDLTVEDVDLIFGDKPSVPNSCRPSISTQYLKRTQTYQLRDHMGASPPLIPCATYIKALTMEQPPTIPSTQPTIPSTQSTIPTFPSTQSTDLNTQSTQMRCDPCEDGRGPMDPSNVQQGGSGSQTSLPSVEGVEEKRGSDVELGCKAKSRKGQTGKEEFRKELHKTKKLLEELGCNYGMDKNKSIGRPSDPDASAPVKRASLPVVSAPSGPSVPPGPPGPSTVTLAPPPGSQAPPPILGPPKPSGPPRRSSRLTAAQQKIHSEPDACQSNRSVESVGHSIAAPLETDVGLCAGPPLVRHPSSEPPPSEPASLLVADTLSNQSLSNTFPSTSSEQASMLTAETAGLCAASTDGLLQRVQSTIEKLNAEYRCLTALHDETIELLAGDADNSTAEETMTLLAACVSTLKGQLQTMSNKYRKMWRGRDTGGCGYNLRSTPTRESSGGTPQRTRGAGATRSKLHVERRAGDEEERGAEKGEEGESEKVELSQVTEPACTRDTASVQLLPSAAVATSTTDPLDPAVLQLLERLADRLVVIVEKRLHV